MTKIGLLSDTHGFLDPALISTLAACDEIWHAGDIGSVDVLQQLEGLGKKLRMVYGNIDGQPIRAVSQLNQIWKIEGMKILMTHIGGYPGRYTSRVKALLKTEMPDIFICGHSHILKVIYDKDLNLLHINPGACGKEGFHKVRTMITFSIEGNKAKDLAIIELGLR